MPPKRTRSTRVTTEQHKEAKEPPAKRPLSKTAAVVEGRSYRPPVTLASRIRTIVKQLPSAHEETKETKEISVGLVFSTTETVVIKTLSLSTTSIQIEFGDKVQASVNRVTTLSAKSSSAVITTVLHILVHLRSLILNGNITDSSTANPSSSLLPKLFESRYNLELSTGDLILGSLPEIAQQLHTHLNAHPTAPSTPHWLLNVPLFGTQGALPSSTQRPAYNDKVLSDSRAKFSAAIQDK